MTEEQKERNRLWVKALRSGDYLQGDGQLHRTDTEPDESFCCLGVACDIAAQYNEGWHWEDAVFRAGRSYSSEEAPHKVGVWFGWPEIGGFRTNVQLPHEGDHFLASDLNDGTTGTTPGSGPLPLTFSQIADLIEKEFDL